MKNYYEILELNPKASKEVIDKAYKALAKKYHPDLYSGTQKQEAEKRLKDINEAYYILSDEFLKEQYDAELKKASIQRQQRNSSNIANQQIHQQTKKAEPSKAANRNYKVGSFSSIVDFTKQLIYDLTKNKEKRNEIKDVTRKDIFAIVLTIIVVIIIGIILWFIPFTNGWIRELLFENPLFNWIGNLFSK